MTNDNDLNVVTNEEQDEHTVVESAVSATEDKAIETKSEHIEPAESVGHDNLGEVTETAKEELKKTDDTKDHNLHDIEKHIKKKMKKHYQPKIIALSILSGVLLVSLVISVVFVFMFKSSSDDNMKDANNYKKEAEKNLRLAQARSDNFARTYSAVKSNESYDKSYDDSGTITIKTDTSGVLSCSYSYSYLYSACKTARETLLGYRITDTSKAVDQIISGLGLPTSLKSSIGNTNSLQGEKSDTYDSTNAGKVKVKYTYHPDNGLWIQFTRVCELQCLKPTTKPSGSDDNKNT